MTMLYDRPTWSLMLDAAKEMPDPFESSDMLQWFAERYPKTNEMTVRQHLRAMSVNVATEWSHRWPAERRIFFKLDRAKYAHYALEKHGAWELGVPAGEAPGSELDIEDAATELVAAQFALELHLEEFMEANWSHLDFGKPLDIYNAEGGYGRQFHTSVGIIDFLCVDKSSGEFWVLELKRGHSSDRVVGQTFRYMGWVRQNLAPDKTVHGLIIAHEGDGQLKYALQMVQNVQAWTYEVNFTFNREAVAV